MNPPVQEAIRELEAAYPGHRVEAVDDGEGGAFVRVHELLYGPQYKPTVGWVTFRVTHSYPHADIYPHYLPAEVARVTDQPLGEAFHKQDMQLGPFAGASTTVSRRSNRWNPAHDTAALKLQKVLDWIRTRP